MGENELEPVLLPSALNAQAQVILPELQLGDVEARLRRQVFGVFGLGVAARGERRLQGRELGLEGVAVPRELRAVLRQVRDGGVHLRGFGGLLGQRLRVRLRLQRRDLDVALAHALVLWSRAWSALR